jgi:hypothetical protein
MFLGSRARPVRGADNLTTICEPIIWTMWDPQHLATLSASTACYGDSFTLFSMFTLPVQCINTSDNNVAVEQTLHDATQKYDLLESISKYRPNYCRTFRNSAKL